MSVVYETKYIEQPEKTKGHYKIIIHTSKDVITDLVKVGVAHCCRLLTNILI